MGTIVVTGSTGFIGKALVEKLEEQGHEVYSLTRNYFFKPYHIECDIIYHLACPSTTKEIRKDPRRIMDTIMDVTRDALAINPSAVFVNASTMGADWSNIVDQAQLSYNMAKRVMEVYLDNVKNREVISYRIPSVYGPEMHDDNFIKRCIDGTAHRPYDPDTAYSIAYIDDVVDALANFTEINTVDITLGEIYDYFSIVTEPCRIEQL